MTISALTLLPLPRATPEVDVHSPTFPTSPLASSGESTPHDFIMLTSDGRVYMVHWGPRPGAPPQTPAGAELVFDEKDELRREAGLPVDDGRWEWEGVCFHPKRTLEGEDGVAEQEKELDKGKGGSAIGVSEKMALVSVGCEECVFLTVH